MSSAIISVGRLAAEIRLQQCIDQFQSSLSKEQQAAFLAARDLAIKATPELRDVMNITAEIDRQGRLRNGVGRRCFGPRMAKILESIQQFVSVGDILIGGSQNLIACGVWSLVRLSLLTASRFSAYLEKVSELFMVVGQSAPRYQSMVALHPRSKQLRQLGIEYQITIVNLCRYIVTTCSKSTVGQLKSMFSDIDMSFHQSELLKWGGAIKDQLNLEEAKGNSKARMQLKEIVARDAVHKNLERKFTLLNACSTFDYQVAWRQTRKCGNATWFIEDESYDRWKRSSASCLLLVSGKLGSGKTVALASILDDVLLNFDSWSAINMFCREDRSESLRSRTVIGCLARQILQTLRPEAINFNESIPRSQVSIETIKDLIGRNVPKSTQLCLIMDGIDECQLDDRSLIIDFLQYLQSCIQLKICLSYRSTADSVIQQELIALGHPITLNMPEENPDIADFIRSKLESCLETGALTLGDPTLVLEIVQTLEMGAKGMFLWAVLQIDTICNQKTDSKIREALHQLPKTLPETFARALSSARKAESEYHERLFNILIAAVQPLSKDEIREALSVRPYEPALDPSHLINDIQAALTTGGSLIVVDEEELTVRFIHPSVKQFLLGDLEIGQKAYIDRANAHLEMAKIVITYLNYNVFDKRVATVASSPSITDKKMYENIISSTSSVMSSSIARSVALHLLRSRRDPGIDVGKTLAKLKVAATTLPSIASFHPYAKANWIEHTRDIESENRLLINIQDVLRKEERSLQVTFSTFVPIERIRSNYLFSRLAIQPCLHKRYVAKSDSRSAHISERFPRYAIIIDDPTGWAIENSHLGIFRMMVRKSIRGIFIALAYMITMDETGPFLIPKNLEPQLFIKLLCICALAKEHDICIRLLANRPLSLSPSKVLNSIPQTLLNAYTVAVSFIHLQTVYGLYSKLKLSVEQYVKLYSGQRALRVVKRFHHHEGEILEVGELVWATETKGKRLVMIHPRTITVYDAVLRVTRVGSSTIFEVPIESLSPQFDIFRTCCNDHRGILIHTTRLCACCVLPSLKDFIEQLGDLSAAEEKPKFNRDKVSLASISSMFPDNPTNQPYDTGASIEPSLSTTGSWSALASQARTTKPEAWTSRPPLASATASVVGSMAESVRGVFTGLGKPSKSTDSRRGI